MRLGRAARRVLPDMVSRADAIANVARSAGLVSILSGAVEATPAALLECTEDLLHQPYRAPLMQRTADAIARLRSEGVAAAVSGAGPSIVCLVIGGAEDGARTVFEAMEGWEPLDVDWNSEGAQILEGAR